MSAECYFGGAECRRGHILSCPMHGRQLGSDPWHVEPAAPVALAKGDTEPMVSTGTPQAPTGHGGGHGGVVVVDGLYTNATYTYGYTPGMGWGVAP